MGQDDPLPLVLTPSARADLEDIWRYSFETWGIAQADRYLAGLDRSLATICALPDIARARTEFACPTRIHRSGKHLILYRVQDGALRVLRVLHARQNWQAFLGDD